MFGLFGAVSLLIFLTPFVGLADTIQEGIVKDIPLEIIYPVISVIYFTIGLIFYLKTKDLVLTMVLWSSMLFGWAHFEDWRYLIFATIAGIGYCQTFRKTNNLFAASALHMLVDVIWGAVLS
jgi:membrane protease YdiL (CAAX protease family)